MKTELVNLVDATGRIVKRGIPRLEIGLYKNLFLQIAVTVVFDADGRVLVQRRALTKKTCPGDIDHVCGVIRAGETPEMAARRESVEETGLELTHLEIISMGVNFYKRFRYLMIGTASGEPSPNNPLEVEWARFVNPNELRIKNKTRELTFVRGFFEEMRLALLRLKRGR